MIVADVQLRPEAERMIAAYPYESKEAERPSALSVPTDMSDWTSINALWETALAKFGRVNVVVNGAGIYEPPSSTFVSEIRLDTFTQ